MKCHICDTDLKKSECKHYHSYNNKQMSNKVNEIKIVTKTQQCYVNDKEIPFPYALILVDTLLLMEVITTPIRTELSTIYKFKTYQ